MLRKFNQVIQFQHPEKRKTMNNLLSEFQNFHYKRLD